jgi:hypothetical protein
MHLKVKLKNEDLEYLVIKNISSSISNSVNSAVWDTLNARLASTVAITVHSDVSDILWKCVRTGKRSIVPECTNKLTEYEFKS